MVNAPDLKDDTRKAYQTSVRDLAQTVRSSILPHPPHATPLTRLHLAPQLLWLKQADNKPHPASDVDTLHSAHKRAKVYADHTVRAAATLPASQQTHPLKMPHPSTLTLLLFDSNKLRPRPCHQQLPHTHRHAPQRHQAENAVAAEAAVIATTLPCWQTFSTRCTSGTAKPSRTRHRQRKPRWRRLWLSPTEWLHVCGTL